MLVHSILSKQLTVNLMPLHFRRPLSPNQFRLNQFALNLLIDGRLIIIASMSGSLVEKVNLAQILKRRLQIIGTTLRNRSLEYKIRLTQEFAEFALDSFAKGQLTPVIDQILSWQQVHQAHQYLEDNLSAGKIVLKITI